MISNNLSLGAIEVFHSFMKENLKSLEDLGILNQSKMDRKKARDLMNCYFKPFVVQEIESRLNTKPFSIVLDETTDITNTQQCAIMVQFHDHEYFKEPSPVLLSLVDTSISQDAESLFAVIDEQLLQKPYGKNVFSIVTDGAKNLIG